MRSKSRLAAQKALNEIRSRGFTVHNYVFRNFVPDELRDRYPDLAISCKNFPVLRVMVAEKEGNVHALSTTILSPHDVGKINPWASIGIGAARLLYALDAVSYLHDYGDSSDYVEFHDGVVARYVFGPFVSDNEALEEALEIIFLNNGFSSFERYPTWRAYHGLLSPKVLLDLGTSSDNGSREEPSKIVKKIGLSKPISLVSLFRGDKKKLP